LINSPEHARRQCDVDAFGLVGQRGDVDRDQPSGPTLEFTLALVLGQGFGSGTAMPSSMATSSHNSIASLAFSMASSIVSPAEKQPGRSGTQAVNHGIYLHHFTYKLKLSGKSNHENRHLFRSQEFVEGGA
jgi:hypothetical protein